MDNNPYPLLSGILWIIQILTAGVLLFHAYFDVLVDVRQKRRAPSATPDDEQSELAHKPVETPQPIPTQEFSKPLEDDKAAPSKAE